MDKEQWQLLADKEEYCIHIECGGECTDADGFFWCHSCLSYVKNNEVAIPNVGK